MPEPDRIPPNMDPRAREFADDLYFRLTSALIAIPIFIGCVIVGMALDVRPQNLVTLLLGLAVLFALVRAAVGWIRRELRRTD